MKITDLNALAVIAELMHYCTPTVIVNGVPTTPCIPNPQRTPLERDQKITLRR